MKSKKMELVFILDKSGSMSGLESDTIGGFNSLLEKQKNGKGEVSVTTVLFNDDYQMLHDHISIQKISPLTPKDYFVGGTTALLDAIGKTIHDLIEVQKRRGRKHAAEKVMIVIITDGLENSSREYSYRKIKELISTEQEKYGWEFLFLGANIDAAKVASDVGIRKERAANYHADSKGTSLNYQVLSDAVHSVREKNTIDDHWKNSIEEDYKNRKGWD